MRKEVPWAKTALNRQGWVPKCPSLRMTDSLLTTFLLPDLPRGFPLLVASLALNLTLS